MMRKAKLIFQFIQGSIAVAIILCCFGIYGEGGCAEPAVKTAASQEESAVFEAAKKYLDAEVGRDLPTVYACLAPSSVYCATHNYEAFLAEANASPVRIVGYKIVRVAHIRDNEDLKSFPKVEKFAQVEIDIIIFYKDTNEKGDINVGFTFIKELGKWYKG
jgi:hypothetical protein